MRTSSSLITLISAYILPKSSFSFVPVISSLLPRSMSSLQSLCPAEIPTNAISFIKSDLAKAIDDRLMSEPGFSIDQLMELAGYSVACAAHDFYLSTKQDAETRKVLVICGPGNNGGDGLVAARHLKHFGYQPFVVYPKVSKGKLFVNLVQQCHDLNITVSDIVPTVQDMNNADTIIDSLFGFSFQGPSREPFKGIIDGFRATHTPVLSVDIPSGWHVDEGDVHATKFIPQGVISLTLPKWCMMGYGGLHYIGGRCAIPLVPIWSMGADHARVVYMICRFMPPKLAAEWNLRMPEYGFGPNQIAKIASAADRDTSYPLVAASDVDQEQEQEQTVAMLVTASSMEQAKELARALVSEKLAACVNLLPAVQSVYLWQEKLEESAEVMLVIKTRKGLAGQVTSRVQQLHSYELPESIVLDIQQQGSNADYLSWIRSNTSPAARAGTVDAEQPEGAEGK